MITSSADREDKNYTNSRTIKDKLQSDAANDRVDVLSKVVFGDIINDDLNKALAPKPTHDIFYLWSTRNDGGYTMGSFRPASRPNGGVPWPKSLDHRLYETYVSPCIYLPPNKIAFPEESDSKYYDLKSLCITLRPDNGEKCVLITPTLQGAAFCWAVNPQTKTPDVCVVDLDKTRGARFLKKYSKGSINLYNYAHQGGQRMQTWGPVAPFDSTGLPQYRRMSEDNTSDATDFSAVIGVRTPSRGWCLYAQKLRRNALKALLHAGGTYYCEEVWELYGPNAANNGGKPVQLK